MLEPTGLLCEYQVDPLGIDLTRPRLSWRSSSSRRGARQSAWQVVVADDAAGLASGRYLWDSGRVEESTSLHHVYGGPPLRSRQRCWWQVRLWDESGMASPWSEPAWWEMGLLDASDWRADWITPDWYEDTRTAEPCPMLRRIVDLDGEVASARLYATSLGLYAARINGQAVSDWAFTPGWTTYHHRLQYQAYDVTSLLHSGPNALAVTLGDGWYRGYLGFQGKRNFYGQHLALLLQLNVTYTDGREVVWGSDGAWRAATGPLRASDIYNGEHYDARLERPGWDTVPYDDRDWSGVRVVQAPAARLVAQNGPPVRPIETMAARSVTRSPSGEIIVDFGQNLVGRVRLWVHGEPAVTVTLRHAEVLDADGNLYIDNLRSAAQADRYITAGKKECYEPLFTFHGFRYVGITGYPGDLPLASIEAIVLHSDMPATGEFTCSHPLLTQLQQNIVWGQKGNFLDVPTDCPQRDERLGWTGDAQVFARTAAFNFLIAPFMAKWLQDLALDQTAEGAVPHVVPDVLSGLEFNGQAWFAAGATGWGDAALIVPWTLYTMYGDERILQQQYASMKAWVEYMHGHGSNEFLFGEGFHFGDWLALDIPIDGAVFGATDLQLIGTAFFAHSTDLLTRVATVLGQREDAARYQDLHGCIVAAFRREFLTPAGRLASNTQTAYVLALMADLLPEEQRGEALRRLVQEIRRRDNHLATGFLGTPYLCPVLERHGALDVAYDLLLQESYPSWLYPVTQGATTIWERWDGQKPDGSFQTPSMNSFNHYAYGAIGEWMVRVVGGIDVDVDNPGFRRARIAPRPGGGITWAKTALETMVGRYAVDWRLRGDAMEVSVSVPPNGAALVRLPGAALAGVAEGGAPLAAAQGCANAHQDGDGVLLEIGAGNYLFTFDTN